VKALWRDVITKLKAENDALSAANASLLAAATAEAQVKSPRGALPSPTVPRSSTSPRGACLFYQETVGHCWTHAKLNLFAGNYTALTPVSSVLQDRLSILSRLSELTSQPLPTAGSKPGGLYSVVSRVLSPRSQLGQSTYASESPYSRGTYSSPRQPSNGIALPWQSTPDLVVAASMDQSSVDQRNHSDVTSVRRSPLSDVGEAHLSGADSGFIGEMAAAKSAPTLPSGDQVSSLSFQLSKPGLEDARRELSTPAYSAGSPSQLSGDARSEAMPVQTVAYSQPHVPTVGSDASVSASIVVQPRRPPPAPLPIPDLTHSDASGSTSGVPTKRMAPSRPPPAITEAVAPAPPSALQRGPSVLSKLTSQLDALRARAQEEVR
jgi:hypothetical protein